MKIKIKFIETGGNIFRSQTCDYEQIENSVLVSNLKKNKLYITDVQKRYYIFFLAAEHFIAAEVIKRMEEFEILTHRRQHLIEYYKTANFSEASVQHLLTVLKSKSFTAFRNPLTPQTLQHAIKKGIVDIQK